jgi:hypothetical protein
MQCRGLGCSGSCQPRHASLGQGCSAAVPCDSTVGWCKDSVCAPYLALNALCTAASRCTPGTFCDGNPSKCVALHPLNGICVATSQCQTNLYCDLSIASPGKCHSLVAAGGTCLASDACAANLRCDSATKTCATRTRELGETCSTNQKCINSYCKGATGSTLGVCTGLMTEGTVCTTTESTCQPHLFCDPGTLRCKALGSRGALCNVQVTVPQCKSMLTCRNGFCDSLGVLNEACTATMVCARPLFCDANAGRCTAQRAVGGECAGASECISQVCSSGTCSASCTY